MFGRSSDKKPQHISFLLTPQFSMVAFSSAIEPLRAANRVARETLFEWELLTVDGLPVRASNEVEFIPDRALASAQNSDLLLICAGIRAYTHLDNRISKEIRTLARKGMPLGSVCTGTVALAEAGVLDGYRCTIHWENIESLAERYPKLNITATRFEADRNRFTCSGGLASMDMMLHSIDLDYGRDLRMKVADQLLYSSIGEPEEMQRMSTDQRTGVRHPKLLAAIGHMETYIENPLSMSELARSIGISRRQLERLFQTHFDFSPGRYYHDLRLDRARILLRQTNMPVLEVALATGFNSASYFTKGYKTKFGYSPRQERDQL